MTSPVTAPRAWPMCRGPVGFALTNSTWTFRPVPIASVP